MICKRISLEWFYVIVRIWTYHRGGARDRHGGLHDAVRRDQRVEFGVRLRHDQQRVRHVLGEYAWNVGLGSALRRRNVRRRRFVVPESIYLFALPTQESQPVHRGDRLT